jgi:hypothetical protein
MTEASPSRRAFARDVSNIQLSDIPTPAKSITSPVRLAQSDSGKSNASPSRSWTSADQFRFVEDDDDEVLFRVRDGALRSLAPSGSAASTALSSEDSIGEKQVRIHCPSGFSLP